MAASITGTFTIIDRASGPMQRMEHQALRTMAAVEAVGKAQDKAAVSHSSAGRKLEETTRIMRQHERQADSMGREVERSGKRADQSGRGFAALASKLGKLGSVFKGLGSMLAAAKLPAMAIGVTVLAQAIGQLAGGAVALLPAIGQAMGAIGAMPQAVMAAAQGMGVFKLATQGVAEALKAGMAIQQNSAQVMSDAANAHVQAVHAVQEAEYGLMQSQKNVTQAQIALTQARRDAVRNLTDLRLAALGADLGQRRAALSLREAQQSLTQAAINPQSTDMQMQDLNLAVSEARLQVRQAGVDRHRAHTDSARAQARGVNGNLQVIAAQRGVTDAMHAEKDAVFELTQAQRALAVEMSRGSGPIATFRQAMKNLSPAAQSFVQHMLRMGPAFKQLRAAAGEQMFPGMERALTNVSRALPMMERVARGTGKVIGQIADDFTRRFTSASRQRDIEALGVQNERILGRMGHGASNLTAALVDFMRAAQPFTEWLSKTLEDATAWVARWSRAKRENGQFAAQLERTRDRLKQFWDIGKNLFGTLKAIFNASKPLGDRLWQDIDRIARRWNEWTNSTTGQNRMTSWFNSLYPGIKAMAKLVGDIAKAWAHITPNPAFAKTVTTLDKAVPSLEKLFTQGSNLGPAAARAISDFAKVLSDLPFSSLNMLLDVLDGIFKLLDLIIRKVPGAKYLISGLLIGGLMLKAINMARSLRDTWVEIFSLWGRGGGPPIGPGGGGGGGPIGPGGGGGRGGKPGIFRRMFGRVGGGTEVVSDLEKGIVGERVIAGSGLLGKFGSRFPGMAGRLSKVPGIGRMLGGAAEGGGLLAKAAEGGGLLSKGAGLLTKAGPLLGVAGKFALPLAALQGLMAFGTFKGNVGQRLQNVVSSETFGLIHAPVTNAMKRQQGQDRAAQYVSRLTGGDVGPQTVGQAQARIGAIHREVGRVRTRALAGTTVTNPMTGVQTHTAGHLGTKDLATIKALNAELKTERKNLIAVFDQQDAAKAQEFGGKLTGIWQVYHKSTKSAKDATKMTVSDVENQMSHMHRKGRTELAQQAYDWSIQFQHAHKGMTGPMRKAREEILDHLRSIGDKATVINGKILTDSKQVWATIGQSLSDPIELAKERVARGFTKMQRAALHALEDMGLTPDQARGVIRGQEAAAVGSDTSLSRTQRVQGAISAATGAAPTSGGAGAYGGHAATGMRIPGVGSHDTVPLMLGMAAPGELIVNRHTEDRVRRKYGVDLGREVAGETRAHSAPSNVGANYGIMPGFARGGRTGNIASMIAAANAINAKHYPYAWGGGHNPGFTGPYDCSGSVSAVLHAGGMLNAPVTSGALAGMFEPGPGAVTIYANPAHTYMSIGSRFFGTSTMNPKGGAGWFAGAPRPGFAVRHVPMGGRATAGQAAAIAALIDQTGGGSTILAPDIGPGMQGAVGNAGVRAYAAVLNSRIATSPQDGGGGGGAPWTGGGRLDNWLQRALRITGHYSPANLRGLHNMAMGESSGNPNAVQQIQDVNSGNGGRNLARGLLQTIPATFNAYKMGGHDNIFNPVDNAIASIRYQFAKYGHIVGHAGYAKGGRIGGAPGMQRSAGAVIRKLWHLAAPLFGQDPRSKPPGYGFEFNDAKLSAMSANPDGATAVTSMVGDRHITFGKDIAKGLASRLDMDAGKNVLHEWAHHFQKLNLDDRALVEGGAEQFALNHIRPLWKGAGFDWSNAPVPVYQEFTPGARRMGKQWLDHTQFGNATGGRLPEWGGWHAQGGTFNVSRPTLFGAGEAGPERVSIGRTSTGGRKGIQVHIAHIDYRHPGDLREAIRKEIDGLASDLDLVGMEED